MTIATAARAYHAAHPEAGPSEIARALTAELGRQVSRAAVQRALTYEPTGRAIGRPRTRVVTCPHCGGDVPR